MTTTTLADMATTLANELTMLEALFDRCADGRFYIDVDEFGVLKGVDATRYFAEEFRSQHPTLIVEQRNTRVYITVPELNP